MECIRCKRRTTTKHSKDEWGKQSSSQLLYHANTRLCRYCYDILYDQVPCVDCFQLIERRNPSGVEPDKNKLVVLCDVCRSQRRQNIHFCTRTWFNCAECARVHTRWCTLPHAIDMNARPRASASPYRSSLATRVCNGVAGATQCNGELDLEYAGFYQWDRFLFCSTRCVQKTFQHVTWCVMCHKHTDTQSCKQCHIPLCTPCSNQWFVEGLCPQCFIDTHPTWPHHALQQVLPRECKDLRHFNSTVRQRIQSFL